MKNSNTETLFSKKLIIYGILLSNSLQAGVLSMKENDGNESVYDQDEVRKIDRIRQQLILDMGNPEYRFKRKSESGEEILKKMNVTKDFLKNSVFKKEIQRQKKRRDKILENILKSDKRYIVGHINNVLRKDGDIPEYMIYLALNESNFNQYALSNAAAKGVWQFMPKTARDYRLKVGGGVDERTDVEKSTEAAVRYLKDMNRFFKSWKLSIMAYNTGPGNVIRSYVYNGTLNKCRRLGKACNTDQEIKKDSNALVRYDLYKGSKNFSALEKVFKKYQGTQDEPTLSQMLETKNKKKQYLPKETRDYVRRILASSIVYNNDLLEINSATGYQKRKYKIHTVKSGETLSEIGQKYGVDYRNIIRDNGLDDTVIRENMKLKIVF